MNKWFILFCLLLIAVWFVLQLVIDARIKETATVCGNEIFTWSWTGLHAHSSFSSTSANVLQRNSSSATVKVCGLQKLYRTGTEDQIAAQQCHTYTVSAVLGFYKMSGNWVLGKVQLQ